MEHGLPALAASVEDGAVALTQSFIAGDALHQQEELTEKRRVFMRCLGQRRDVAFGDDEDVGRGLWGDVAEGDRCLGLGDDLRRNCAIADLAE